MKKLFLALAVLITGAGASFAQTNNAAKPPQEKTKHIKKEANSTADKTSVAANTTASKAVASNKGGKHHKKAKKAKAQSGK